MVAPRDILTAFRSPRGRRGLRVAGVVALLLIAYGLGSRQFAATTERYRAQQAELAAAREEIARLRQDLVNREVADRVDTASLEEMRQQLVGLQAALSRQEGELELYRNLLDDQEDATGLQVEGLTLRRAPGLDSFQYRIVVRRRASHSESVDVAVSLSIDGQRGGEPASIPFNEADLSMPGDALSIRFKYFKVLRGTFVLPADFVPSKVVLSVLEKGNPSSLRIVEFPWQVM